MDTSSSNRFNAARLLLITTILWAGNLSADGSVELAALFPESVPLNHTGAGSYSLIATVGGVDAEFLLDTGASMATVNADLFKAIRERGEVTKIRAVGARLASGKLEMLDVYLVQHFTLGDNCDLGPLEVAVLNKGGRNLLGMNALQQAAPFAISLSPPALALSQCGLTTQLVGLRD